VIFAAPDYRYDGPIAAPDDQLVAQLRGGSDEVFRGATSSDVRGLNWSPLPATAVEAEQIAAILGADSQFAPIVPLTGSAALEDTLKQLRAPRILHLATHGYYLPNQEREANGETALGETGLGDDRGGLTAAKGLATLKSLENPLLRAGIVLAGANRQAAEDPENAEPSSLDDGWVTAEEIGLLDLTGTELVVLSACETGLGDIRTGEGVSGLRRAFTYAGAQTLVTSLYKVPDADTQQLMVDFYRGLAAEKPKIAALREAELAAIERRREEHGAAHPFFWASFILVGDPR
jgi:CHAT domain-containing protein